MNKVMFDLTSIGIHEGLSVEVHSSMKKIDNGSINPNDIIDSLKYIVTDNGTIVMAAFPLSKCIP